MDVTGLMRRLYDLKELGYKINSGTEGIGIYDNRTGELVASVVLPNVEAPVYYHFDDKTLKRVLGQDSSSESHEKYEDTRLQVDFDAHRVIVDENEVYLTKSQFALLACLVRNYGKLVRYPTLYKTIYETGEYDGHAASLLKQHLLYLRRKMGCLGPSIVNVKGVGYRYDPIVKD